MRRPLYIFSETNNITSGVTFKCVCTTASVHPVHPMEASYSCKLKLCLLIIVNLCLPLMRMFFIAGRFNWFNNLNLISSDI